MIKDVLKYKENYGNKYPSIVLLPVCSLSEDLKNQLFAYMTNSRFLEWVGFGEALVSPFTHEKIPALGNTFTDGMYRWCDDLPIYMKENNVALPDEFIDHVLESANANC